MDSETKDLSFCCGKIETENFFQVGDNICDKDHLGSGLVKWGKFGTRQELVAESGEKLVLTCERADPNNEYEIPHYALYYYSPGGKCKPIGKDGKCKPIGLCPFNGGVNKMDFWYVNDDGDDTPDCFDAVRQISKDYSYNDGGKNSPPKESCNIVTHEGNGCTGKEVLPPEDPDKLDWFEISYDIENDQYMAFLHRFNYNKGNYEDTEYGSKVDPLHPPSEPEGLLIEVIKKDPPLDSPETIAFLENILESLIANPLSEPMFTDDSKPCDFNHDGICNAKDLFFFQRSLGTCRGDANYYPLADGNGDGCITAIDKDFLLLNNAMSMPWIPLLLLDD
jgi:hypothetical protein